MLKLFSGGLLLFGLMAGQCLAADVVPYAAPQSTKPAAVVSSMRALAHDVLPLYRDVDRERYLDVLFRLQIVAGEYAQAINTIEQVRMRRADADADVDAQDAPPLYLQYEFHADACLRVVRAGTTYEPAYQQVFAERMGRLDDKTALVAQFQFNANLADMRKRFDKALASAAGLTDLPMQDAVELLRSYMTWDAYRQFLPLAPRAIAQDDARRYLVEDDILVPTPDGAHVAAMLVRPRDAAVALPTLLGFTIYANDDWSLVDARKMAAHGYAGVVAYTRGKGRSPDAVVPYEHDGDDARAVIGWITKQPWSDGRVGMYGGSYNGFAAWAAAKHPPQALKAIMTSATAAPGIDVPMERNVFMNFLFPWLPYVTSTKGLDDASYGDQAHWQSLNRDWYASGRAYRDLDTIDDMPSPIWRRWLQHPAYDAYWQEMIPYGKEFTDIDIPVLQTTGYFDGAQVGVLHYLREHMRYNPSADHTLLIGPYEHFTMQTGVPRVVQGYDVDPVAMIDLQELRLQWFDHVLRGKPRPAILVDKINFEVMGANTWRHVGSLDAMHGSLRRYHLSSVQDNGTYQLLQAADPAAGPVVQVIDFQDRSDAEWMPAPLAVNPTLDLHDAVAFASPVFDQPVEVSGVFSGMLDVAINKRDMDFSVTLYEHMANGSYLQLSSYMARASHVVDRSERHLLTPGKRTRLPFESERLTSRLLGEGSRLVVVIGINKQPGLQINYGTGGDVSDETVADASVPLRVEWHPDSYLDIPISE